MIMNSQRCVHSSGIALYRVFVAPTAQLESRFVHRLVPSWPQKKSAPREHVTIPAQIRSYAISKPGYRRPRNDMASQAEKIDEDLGYDKRYTTQELFQKSGKDRLPQDFEITDPKIMIIDKGEAEGPIQTAFALTKLSPNESLRMIKPYVPADQKNKNPACYAICKIFNKQQEFERQMLLKEKKKNEVAIKTKELEMSWVIGDHDLVFKMKHLQNFLQKGMKVIITLGARRKGAKKPTVDMARAEEVLKKVKEEAILAGRETKKPEGNPGKLMRLYYEGIKAL